MVNTCHTCGLLTEEQIMKRAAANPNPPVIFGDHPAALDVLARNDLVIATYVRYFYEPKFLIVKGQRWLRAIERAPGRKRAGPLIHLSMIKWDAVRCASHEAAIEMQALGDGDLGLPRMYEFAGDGEGS